MQSRRKVVVAMSGGVDSSVAAALLRDQGFEVTGMMLRLWSEPGNEESNRCCTPDAMALARRVAAQLDIPFYVIDAKSAFRASVVEAFLDGYGRGETPNPCLVCNRQIRWTFLLDHALALGADFLATGHYARVQQDADGTVKLLRAVDAAKDQSYVLHVLDQPRLRRALFPIGDYSKPEVRRMAEAYSLPTATRYDSQDLCFLAGGDYREFIRRNRPDMLTPGKIIAHDGSVLGEHAGLAGYTIGQRRGLGLDSSIPMYVLGKDVKTNTLIVGVDNLRRTRELTAETVNWISGDALRASFRADVKIRYTAKAQPAEVLPRSEGNAVRIVFDDPQPDVTSGQAAVFYQGEQVLGGGIIRSGAFGKP